MAETQTLTFESVGLKGSVQNVPANEAEWDALAGDKGYKMRDAALDQIKFHGIMGDFRGDLMDKIIEVSGVEPLKEPKLDAEKKPVLDEQKQPVMVVVEKPAAYIERVAAQQGKTPAELYQGVADEWSTEAKFSTWLTLTPRGAGGPAVGKRDLATAVEILANPERLARTTKQFKKHSIAVPDAPTAEQYALLIKELRAKLEAQALA